MYDIANATTEVAEFTFKPKINGKSEILSKQRKDKLMEKYKSIKVKEQKNYKTQ